MGHTHAAFGLLVGLVAFSSFSFSPPLFVVLVVFGSLLPDVDSEGSKINKILPVTRWVPYLFKHRGFFHSGFPAMLIYILFLLFGFKEIGIALTIGYLSHLFLDGLTKMGINLLHPLSTLHVRGFVETGGIVETFVFLGFVLVDGLFLWRILF